MGTLFTAGGLPPTGGAGRPFACAESSEVSTRRNGGCSVGPVAEDAGPAQTV